MSSFEDFWKAYPKKEGKKTCRDKWAVKKLDEKASMIIAHVEVRAKQDKKWLAGYIPMPATFINQERWDDEYERKWDPRSEAPKPVGDPDAISMGVMGMARFYHIQPIGLTEEDICRIVWALRLGGNHVVDLGKGTILKRAYMQALDDIASFKIPEDKKHSVIPTKESRKHQYVRNA